VRVQYTHLVLKPLRGLEGFEALHAAQKLGCAEMGLHEVVMLVVMVVHRLNSARLALQQWGDPRCSCL
jgi:hypothetical protein